MSARAGTWVVARFFDGGRWYYALRGGRSAPGVTSGPRAGYLMVSNGTYSSKGHALRALRRAQAAVQYAHGWPVWDDDAQSWRTQ